MRTARITNPSRHLMMIGKREVTHTHRQRTISSARGGMVLPSSLCSPTNLDVVDHPTQLIVCQHIRSTRSHSKAPTRICSWRSCLLKHCCHPDVNYGLIHMEADGRSGMGLNGTGGSYQGRMWDVYAAANCGTFPPPIALFDMPNSNRFDILSILISSEISLSISIYSRTALSISILIWS